MKTAIFLAIITLQAVIVINMHRDMSDMRDNMIPVPLVEDAVLTAHEIGLNKCPPDTHCVDHGGVKGLVKLSLSDIENML